MSICALQAELLDIWTLNLAHTLRIIIYLFEGKGHRSKVKVAKVKIAKIPGFSLVSGKLLQGHGHESQGPGHKLRSKVKS